jgi:superfamily II DNA/RNA helicase
VAIARGQMSNRDLREQLTAGCDILVTTPGKLSQYLAENWIQLNCVQFVIIDEVDKFVNDDQMLNVLYKLREKLHAMKVKISFFSIQLVFLECNLSLSDVLRNIQHRWFF